MICKMKLRNEFENWYIWEIKLILENWFEKWIQEVILRNGFEVFIKKMKMNLQNGIRFKNEN